MARCIVCGGPTVDGTGGPCSIECAKTTQRTTAAMTQPISPDEGDALKVCPMCAGACRVEHLPATEIVQGGMTLWVCANSRWFGGRCLSDAYLTAEAWNTRTPPPVAMDEVGAAIERLTDLGEHPCRAGSSFGQELLGFAALLTRIKDSSK